MVNIYVEISKYLIIIVMALYTFCNFRYFSVTDKTAADGYCRVQRRAVIILQLIAYSVIYLQRIKIISVFYFIFRYFIKSDLICERQCCGHAGLGPAQR